MRRPSLLLSSAVLALAACSDPVTVTKPALNVPEAVSHSVSVATRAVPTDQHIFVMNGNSIPDNFAASVAAAGGTIVRVHAAIGVAVVRGLKDAAANDIARGIAKVDRDLLVQWVPTLEEVHGYVADAVAQVPAQSALPPESAAFLAFQWNMRQIHAPEAWSTPGVIPVIPSVRVAIIDTGLDPDHIDATGLIDAASSVAFAPSVSGPPAWADDQFHGTHVGGIVTTNDIGTAGVAPNVTLIAIKVLNSTGSGTFAAVIAGLLWAADVHANVANLSLGALLPKNGSGQLVAALNRAVDYANAHGVLVVSSAGNDAVDLQHDGNYIEIPCESGTGMCISSTGPGDQRSSFSNYGVSAISVAAPGGEFGAPPTHFVLSPCSSRTAVPSLAACKSRTRYLFAIGTSQAAPHVSGLAALLDSQYGGMASPAQLQTRLQQCSDDIGKPGADPYFGQGQINALKTVTGTGCNNSTP
jgi:subtilisin family serine protease